MKRWFEWLVSLAIALGAIGAAQAQSKPLVIADSQRDRWSAIGKLNINGYRSAGSCTGTLIAPDLVLTAAHCVVNPKLLLPYPLYRIQFVAGWHKGEHRGAATAKAVWVHPDYDMTTEAERYANPKNTGRDIALIVLTQPIDGIVPATVSDMPGSGGPVALLGYRRDRPDILTDYSGCSSPASLGGIVLLSCAVVEGTSGAPIFRKSEDGWEIIGVVSSRREGAKGPRSMGAAVDQGVLKRVRSGGE